MFVPLNMTLLPESLPKQISNAPFASFCKGWYDRACRSMPILCSRLRHVHVLLHHRPGRCLGFRDGDAAMLHVQVGHELPGEVFVYMLLPETNGVSLEAEIPEVVVLDSMAELLQLQLTALDTF